MADIKEVAVLKRDIQKKAIVAHAGFVRCVTGLVEKHGEENVLNNPELKWLLKQYERVVEFSESIQMKEVTQKVEHAFDSESPYTEKLITKLGLSKPNEDRPSAVE